jgi:hypothetical protein
LESEMAWMNKFTEIKSKNIFLSKSLNLKYKNTNGNNQRNNKLS